MVFRQPGWAYPNLKKPWYRANEYECLAIAHELSGQKEEAKEALIQAVKYARVTPKDAWIFSEENMKLSSPDEFISECSGKIKLIEPEVSGELSNNNEIS